MKSFKQIVAGATAAAIAIVALAAPADAQYRDRYYRHNRGGIDAGDVIAGVAIIGGIAAIASALDNDGRRYGYGNRYRYRDDYRNAVNACGYEADRYGRGRISITDVDRTGNGYRVRGVIDGQGGYGGYDGYNRYDRYDRYGGYNRYDRYDARVAFTCRTDRYGRVRDFDVNRYGNRYGW
ncbi:MAG TPA: hypothetical protein VF662_03915 [Allosphingosinicella sp.]|jgi:hypothetical protein